MIKKQKKRANHPFFYKIESKNNFIFLLTMNLEEFLNPPDNSWHIQQAHQLISHACHMVTLLEKGQYSELSEFLEKKESYLAVLKELELLVDKYNLRKWIHPYGFCDEPTDEKLLRDVEFNFRTKEEWISDSLEQDLLYRHDQLVHADKLVAHDYDWRQCLYVYDSD